MNRLPACLLVFCAALFSAATTFGDTWTFQYSLPVASDRGEHRSFLWIPPEASQVRGLVVGGMTLAERDIAKDPLIRQACAEQQLGILFFTVGLGGVDLQRELNRLAEVSGYSEIAHAPLFFVGHSAGGPQAKRSAFEMADRCFGLMQFRGGTPVGGEHATRPGIPVLVMMGQFDEFAGLMRDAEGRERAWEIGRDDVVRFRSGSAAHLGSIAVEPGAGHFAWSERNGRYLAMFIAKAAEARIPQEWPVDQGRPPALKTIDPKSGWLTDLDIRNPDRAPAAAYEAFTGDRSRAAWHFDQELAEATEAFHVGLNRKDQFIQWQDRFWVDAGVRFFFQELKWVEDGRTLQVHPVFAEQYPPNRPNGPQWLQSGEPAGNSGTPIHVRPLSGPIVAVGNHRLRVQHDALAPAGQFGRATFLAYTPGDETFRHTETVGMFPRGYRGFTRGAAQTITFAPLPDVRQGADPVRLEATSDAGLEVDFYVAYGPAIIKDGRLHIHDLPKRAKLPIVIEVVAYHPGRGIAPEIQAAEPVSRTFRVLPAE